MSLEVRRMRHVIALADHGSFARAATVLGLSQSALSRSIQSVERDVGSRLFVRTASGVELTDGGRVLVARIRQIVQLTEDLDRDLTSERGLHSGHVHVGAGPYPAQSVLADALARFIAAHPRVIVRVTMRDWDELLRRLRAREIEFFVGETSTFGAENDLDIEQLDVHPMLICARRGHPLASLAPVTFSDGLAFPYVSVSRIPPRILEPIRAAQRRLPDATAAHRVFPALEFNSIDAVKQVVLGSDALMVAPPTCVADELTAAGARFREYLLEAERACTERERQLIERWRPPPAKQVAARPPAGTRGAPAGAATPAATGRRKDTFC